MPVYRYKCKKCESIHDITHSMKENSKTTCPKCNEKSLQRDYSTINLIANTGKHDPTSPLYWKNGKTEDQISKVIENKTEPY